MPVLIVLCVLIGVAGLLWLAGVYIDHLLHSEIDGGMPWPGHDDDPDETWAQSLSETGDGS
jgi:hypothetical protein